jgi:hypothetical protein
MPKDCCGSGGAAPAGTGGEERCGTSSSIGMCSASVRSHTPDGATCEEGAWRR